MDGHSDHGLTTGRRQLALNTSDESHAGVSDRYIVEYFGETPHGCSHGKCQRSECSSVRSYTGPVYERTEEHMEEISYTLQHHGASEVYIADAPCNVHVVLDKKASQAHSARRDTGDRACHMK